MTKNFLLTAGAVSALLLAGAAQASDFDSVVFAGVTQTDNTDQYTIADVAQATGDTYSGSLAFTVGYDNALPTANNLLIRIELGNATFGEAVTAADLDGFDQTIISDGGAEGDNYVVFLVSLASDATAVTSFDFTSDSIEFVAGAQPFLRVNTKTEAGGTVIEGGLTKFPNGTGGNATQVNLVDYASVVDVDIDAADDTAVLSLNSTPVFTQFTTGSDQAAIGTISVSLNEVYLPDEDGVLPATVVDDSVIDEVSATFTGDQAAGLTIVAGDDGIGTLPTDDLPYSGTVYANIAPNATPLQSGNPTATVTVSFANDDFASIVRTADLAPIRRDGVSAEVPWVASSALAARNSTVSVIRVANKSEDAANVYVEIATTASAQGLTPTGVVSGPQLVGQVGANTDLQIPTALLTSKLGEFVRGNVIVTVEAAADEITVNNRISYADGKVEETEVRTEGGLN